MAKTPLPATETRTLAVPALDAARDNLSRSINLIRSLDRLCEMAETSDQFEDAMVLARETLPWIGRMLDEVHEQIGSRSSRHGTFDDFQFVFTPEAATGANDD